MDTSRITAWTRRRFGIASGRLFAALIAASNQHAAGAKKKHRKKKRRCLKPKHLCGGKKKCCKGLGCDFVGLTAGFHCCKNAGQACPSGDTDECCRELDCLPTSDPDAFPGLRCCGVLGSTCDDARPCCENLDCQADECVAVV